MSFKRCTGCRNYSCFNLNSLEGKNILLKTVQGSLVSPKTCHAAGHTEHAPYSLKKMFLLKKSHRLSQLTADPVDLTVLHAFKLTWQKSSTFQWDRIILFFFKYLMNSACPHHMRLYSETVSSFLSCYMQN